MCMVCHILNFSSGRTCRRGLRLHSRVLHQPPWLVLHPPLATQPTPARRPSPHTSGLVRYRPPACLLSTRVRSLTLPAGTTRVVPRPLWSCPPRTSATRVRLHLSTRGPTRVAPRPLRSCLPRTSAPSTSRATPSALLAQRVSLVLGPPSLLSYVPCHGHRHHRIL
jgi:hypothetical protein